MKSRFGRSRTSATLFGNGAGETASFDAATGLVTQILAGTANSIASFSYAWDAIGNLASRADTYQGYTEQFCYDALNRLTNYALGASCTAAGTKTVGYDALGNITAKSDVGTYAYPAAGQARPHAVSSIAGTVNGVLNPAFTYDANGNMVSGAGRSIAWTSFNMAQQVTEGTTTVAFAYDSDHARITQTIGGASPSTTTYLNAMGAQSEKFVAGATTTWHDYIYAAGSLVAERFCTGAAPCSTGATMRYAVDDHLGSPSSLTDAGGAVTERLSYDAWGQRRNANGTDAVCGSIASVTTRGFTGHEMLDAVCLVNMNARLYDPAIGRFMSADSVVSNPLNGQSFNRYAYVGNNPLNATDPTGHMCQDTKCDHPVIPSKTDPGGPYIDPFPGGIPCYGCFGPGNVAGPDGRAISITSLGFVNYNALTFTAKGQSVTCATSACANDFYKSLISANPTVSQINYVFPQLGLRVSQNFVSYGGSTSFDAASNTGTVVCGCYQTFSVSRQGSDGFFGPAATFIGGAGVLSDVTRYSAGAATIGTNLRLYANGFRGNQYVATGRIAAGAELAGNVFLGLSVALDLYGRATGQISDAKLTADLAVDGIGFFGGPIGAGIAGAYYGLDTFYPGGAAGALTDALTAYGNNIQQNQAINPNYSPTDPGKISFHPKTRVLIPNHKKTKKRGDVIDPYDLPMDPGKI